MNSKILELQSIYELLRLMYEFKPDREDEIEYLHRCFIDDCPPDDFQCNPFYSTVEDDFKKYSDIVKNYVEYE